MTLDIMELLIPSTVALENLAAAKVSSRQDFRFTIIELLVVVAIVAILMSILFPALKVSMAKAQQISCANNLKTLHLVCDYYYDNYDGYVPPAYDPLGAEQCWYNLISRNFFGSAWYKSACFRCPSNQQSKYWVSYARNRFVSGSYAMGVVRAISIRQPSHILNLADVGDNNATLGSDWDYDLRMDYAPNTGYRHNCGANGLFYDGHVSWSKAYFPNEWFIP